MKPHGLAVLCSPASWRNLWPLQGCSSQSSSEYWRTWVQLQGMLDSSARFLAPYEWPCAAAKDDQFLQLFRGIVGGTRHLVA